MEKMDIEHQIKLRDELFRRNFMNKQFDKILKESHKGDLNEMYLWIFSNHCKKQFIDEHYDYFILDFHRWMKKHSYILSDS